MEEWYRFYKALAYGVKVNVLLTQKCFLLELSRNHSMGIISDLSRQLCLCDRHFTCRLSLLIGQREYNMFLQTLESCGFHALCYFN
jgi:hypothetical protein